MSKGYSRCLQNNSAVIDVPSEVTDQLIENNKENSKYTIEVVQRLPPLYTHQRHNNNSSHNSFNKRGNHNFHRGDRNDNFSRNRDFRSNKKWDNNNSFENRDKPRFSDRNRAGDNRDNRDNRDRNRDREGRYSNSSSSSSSSFRFSSPKKDFGSKSKFDDLFNWFFTSFFLKINQILFLFLN